MTRSDSWVCLMYHDVLPRASATGGGAERFAVPLPSFELMLDAIGDGGYEGCSLTRAVRQAGRKRVAITFDDGTESQFQHAVPALRSRNMTATFFVTTDWIGRAGFMTWDQLRTLASLGMSVQSHTKSHSFLSELGEGELRRELAESKAAIDEALGQETTEISLPGGNAPRRARWHLFREVGYRLVAGSRWGRNADVVGDTVDGSWVRRCTVRGSIDVEEAERILAGDRSLALKRIPREMTLNALRAALGASRYARWRRKVLDKTQ